MPASTPKARFANSRPGGPQHGSGGSGNYRGGGGGEEDSGRGRKFDKRVPRSHQVSTAAATQPSSSSSGEPSAGAAGEASQGNRPLESPGVSEAKKTQHATRSPRSPRSPRRGFGERGAESRNNSNPSSEQDGTATAPRADVTTEGHSGEKKDVAESGSSVAAGAPATTTTASTTTSAKKRKPVRKNKRRDDDEGSVVSHSSTKEGDSSLETRESGKGGSGNQRKQSGPDDSSATPPSKEINPAVKGESAASSKEESTVPASSSNAAWVPKSKFNQPHQRQQQSDSPSPNSRQPYRNNGPRDNNHNTRGDSPSFISRNSYLGQRNGSDGQGRRPHHSDRGSREADSGDWNSGATGYSAKSRWTVNGGGSAHKNTSQDQIGWGEAPPSTQSVGDGWRAGPVSTHKDASQEQAGWGAPPPADAQTSGWGDAPAVPVDAAQGGGWGKPPSKGQGKRRGDPTANSQSSDGRWGDNSAKSHGRRRGEPTTTSQNSGRGEAPVTSQSSGWGEAPKKSQGSGWGEAPVTAATTTTQTGGWDEAPVTAQSDGQKDSTSTREKRLEDSSATTQSGGKTDTLAETVVGWGEAPPAAQNDGWGQTVTTTTTPKWGESVPWETNTTTAPSSTSGWGNEPDTSQKQELSHHSNNGDNQQRRTGVGRGKPYAGGDSRFGGAGPPQGYQRGGSFQDGRGDRRFRDADPERQTQSSSLHSQPPKDARSSLDARNARLGIQRGPRPHEDNRTEQRGESSEVSTRPSTHESGSKDVTTGSIENHNETKRPSATGSGDARFDVRASGTRPGQRNGPYSNQFGQREASTEFFQRKSPTSRGNYDKPGQGRTNAKPREYRDVKQMPLFSNTLECQMTWKEMDLKSDVLAQIAKAGLETPSNIQKLVMKPFKQGKDVIAQTQSQKDRTNTLAIALLEKLSSKAHTHKHPQAVVICSDGINPQKVNEDFQDWFEAIPGLNSIYLTSEDLGSEESVLSDQEQAKQVIVTTLGPLMEVLRKELVDMKFVETVVISMRADELVNFDAFKQFWAMLPRDAQVVLMTGRVQPQIQLIKTQNFRANTAVRRADELTMQWSDHFYVDIPLQTAQSPTDVEDSEAGEVKDHKWEVLMQILGKNPEISHIVILTQSQSLTQALTAKLEEQKLPVLSVWSMADKTEVARQFNQPERCILVSESLLMDSLDLDHSSLVINYEMPKRSSHYISSFGPFGRSGLRTLMINFCVKEDPIQLLTLESMEAMYGIKILEMQMD
ncbi:Eukaryotic initiation factor 4A-III [Mortierella sp. AD031]|nr:Eukaryotic initiation factor 4A-III [Mortierella sp. AD031]